MRFLSAPFAFFAFASMAFAVRIPEGLPEGFYLITVDDAGNDNFTLINDQLYADAPKGPPSGPPSSVAKRAPVGWPRGTYPVCSDAQWTPSSDFYDHAYGQFWANCQGQWVKNKGHIAGYWGNAVAFMCSYGDNPCVNEEFASAVGWVADHCKARDHGYQQSGWLNVPPWKKVRRQCPVQLMLC